MGGFANSLAQGFRAARDPQYAQSLDQKKEDQTRLQLAPITQAIAADRQKLTAFIDDKGNVIPEHQKDYDATVKSMTEMLGRARSLLGQKAPNEDPNHFESTVANLTDKLHITRDLAHRLATRQSDKVNKYYDQTNQMGQDTAAGVLPFAMTPTGQEQAAKTASALTEEQLKAKDAAALETQRGEQAIALEREKQKDKTPKGLKAMEQGGVAFGIEDQDAGKQYLPSQLGPQGDATPEAKQMWQTYQAEKVRKEAEEHRKEDDQNERQAKTIAAGFERMGQSQLFQELMAQYRSDLTENRAQQTLANNSEATVNALKAQYAQPGNKSVADNELQNFYTTVVQKGGRKTAAELALTLKIGSLGLNLQQAFQKAATGELPEPLRKALLEGMEAVAKEQRAEADRTKPELPKLNIPEGPKTKALRSAQSGGNSEADPLGILK